MAPTSMPTPSSYNYDRQKNAPKELRDAYNYYFGAVFGWAENSNLKSVTTVDDFTVTFTLGKPQLELPDRPGSAAAVRDPEPDGAQGGRRRQPRSDQEQVRPGPGDGHGRHRSVHVQGVGPDDHVTIAKNPNYWNKDGMAHLDEVIYKPFADQSAELNALQSDGGIDVAQTIPPNDVAGLKADPTYRSSTVASRATTAGCR